MEKELQRLEKEDTIEKSQVRQAGYHAYGIGQKYKKMHLNVSNLYSQRTQRLHASIPKSTKKFMSMPVQLELQ